MKIPTIIILIFYSINLYGQDCNTNVQENFIKLKYKIDSLKSYYSDTNNIPKYKLGFTEPNILTSEEPINLKLKAIVLKNPYGTSYPLSYSIILDTTLIALFEPGKFVCYNLSDFNRNFNLEKIINTKLFEYHWLYQGKLVAFSDGKYFTLSDSLVWKNFEGEFPVIKRPIIFEDNEFAVFRDYYGEWGGTLYFFDKKTKQYYYTEASQATSVLKSNSGYEILISSFNRPLFIRTIIDPRCLSRTTKEEAHQGLKFEALGYSDTSTCDKPLFWLTKNELLGFSFFQFNDHRLYLIHQEKTFLAEFIDDKFKMVYPLFNDGLFTHHPLTRTYNDITLINMDHYGTTGDREMSSILIMKDQIVKIDWNETHCR